jgi:hypothetical protein
MHVFMRKDELKILKMIKHFGSGNGATDLFHYMRRLLKLKHIPGY